MANPNKPFNDLAGVPAPDLDFKDPDILIASIATSQAIGSLNTILGADKQNITHSLNLMSPLYVPEAVASSGIENIITTNERIYQAKILEAGEIKPHEKEVMRYTAALIFGFKELVEKDFLATNQYIAIQKTLEPTKSGIRKLPGTQLKNPHTGVVYYTPPEGEGLIRELLSNYEKYFNEKAPEHEIFGRAAVLHYQFEAIHPFHDGNGRTGRMLIPLYLSKQRALHLPLLFVSKFILENRDDYYLLLRNVTYKGEWKPWVLYILKALEKQAKYTLKVLQKIHDFQQELEEKLEKLVGHAYARDIAKLLYLNPYFVQKDFESGLKVAYVTARKYLAILEKEQVIVKKKQPKRNRFLYVCPEYIKLLKNA
ncbi:MAG: Fic family protein [Patescibacteria group bacterium]